MTNIGPLTTVYTPPASCTRSTGWYKSFETTVNDAGETEAVYFDYRGPISIDDCLPPGFNAETRDYYSPGVCPSAYTSACSRPGDFANPSLTKVICCPSGTVSFGCQSNLDVNHKCGYSVSTGEGVLDPLTVIESGSVFITVSTVSEGYIHAFGVEVWSVPEPTTTTTEENASSRTGGDSSTESRERQSSATSTNTPPSDAGGGDGLGTGAVAGIAVGATVSGLVIGALLIFLFMRRRAKAKAQTLGDGRMTPAGALKPDPGHTVPAYYEPVGTQPRSEMAAWPGNGNWSPPEMSATVSHPHELYSGEGRDNTGDGNGGAEHVHR
ncbi:hypothetical protein B0T11DRAFT_23508 [Plectosphaerella cucumerina]|uniref:Uncharacterized protein n=1 Tax=Plectosphaerella cucumerina TaxID=40658 RepID=A0A8K0TQM2_9PEZI|nr:hypothetical protein B0T11DRAFT_23508 [Plectosphaerella cucumerina]